MTDDRPRSLATNQYPRSTRVSVLGHLTPDNSPICLRCSALDRTRNIIVVVGEECAHCNSRVVRDFSQRPSYGRWDLRNGVDAMRDAIADHQQPQEPEHV